MSYSKKKMDGIYLKWYNILKANDITIPSCPTYLDVSSDISNLDWEGQGKNAICDGISRFDDVCNQLSSEISLNINKLQICLNTLSLLETLKNTYEQYNSLVDEYYAILAKIERDKKKKVI